MTLDDILYRLGATIGWDRCDYATNSDGDAYGITDGRATLALVLDGDVLLWATYMATPEGPEPLDEGGCPVTAANGLLGVWREAAAIALPHEERVARLASRLAEEGWTHELDGDMHILRCGRATVTITPDGEVASDDPAARLYVHAGYSPEDYGIYPTI